MGLDPGVRYVLKGKYRRIWRCLYNLVDRIQRLHEKRPKQLPLTAQEKDILIKVANFAFAKWNEIKSVE